MSDFFYDILSFVSVVLFIATVSIWMAAMSGNII